SIMRLDGTGWRTADASARIRPQGMEGPHSLLVGLHGDRFELQNLRYATSDWISGGPGALQTAARGKSETTAAYVQDVWRLNPTTELTLGLRTERWRAFDGRNTSASPVLDVSQPERTLTRTSPKASLVWRPSMDWKVSASFG